MSPLRRTQRFGIALSVACLFVALCAAMVGRDNPNIDTRRAGSACNFEAKTFDEIPSGRSYQSVLNLEPRVRVTPQGDPKKPGSVRIEGGVGLSWDLRRSRFDPLNCGGTFKKNNIRLDNGLTFNVSYEWLHNPNERAYLRFSNVKLGREGLADWVIAYTPSLGDTRPETPADPGIPGVPVPSDPGAPTVPGPGDDTPGFTGLQNLGGPIVRPGGRFNGFFQSRDHSAEECAKHTYDGVKLCELGSGPSVSEVYGLTANGFRTRRLGPPKTGLSWEDAACAMDGCGLRGSFYGQPLRTRLGGVRAPNITELFADASVYLNEGRPNADVVYFEYRATYLAPGSTGSASPLPSVPNVPVPPSQPVPTTLIFRGPNGLQVGNGNLFNVNLSVLDHGQNHEGHSVVYNGRRYYMCQFQNNQSTLRAFDTSADRFSIEKTTPPNLGWEWRPFQCDPTGCRGEGTYFSQPVRAWTPEPPKVSPGGQSFDGKLNIELNNDVVPYRFAGKIEYKF